MSVFFITILGGHLQKVRALPLPNLLVKEDLSSLLYRKGNLVQREYLLFVKIPWKYLVNLGNGILPQSLLYCHYHFFFPVDHPVLFLLYALYLKVRKNRKDHSVLRLFPCVGTQRGWRDLCAPGGQ